jgi:fatty acid desaturase
LIDSGEARDMSEIADNETKQPEEMTFLSSLWAVISFVFHCIASLFNAADAIAKVVWTLILCLLLLLIASGAFYLAFGWFAGIFKG